MTFSVFTFLVIRRVSLVSRSLIEQFFHFFRYVFS
jgi:hypothetical protein